MLSFCVQFSVLSFLMLSLLFFQCVEFSVMSFLMLNFHVLSFPYPKFLALELPSPTSHLPYIVSPNRHVDTGSCGICIRGGCQMMGAPRRVADTRFRPNHCSAFCCSVFIITTHRSSTAFSLENSTIVILLKAKKGKSKKQIGSNSG